MRYFSLLVCLLVSLLALPNASIAAQAPPTNTPASLATSPVNTAQTTSDWQYQQLFAIHSQLARLDEQLKQQAALGSDVKALETTQQAIKVQLANLQTKLEVQEKVQINQLNGFDGRIGDLKDSINMWFFTLTILLALGGYIVYRQSKKEAEDVAGKQMETFIAKNADQILEKAKSSLESKVDELNLVVNGLNEYLIEAREIIYDKQKEVEVAADNTLKAIAAKQELDPDDLRVLENSTKRVDKEHATAQEYLNFAMVSHAHKDYQTALKWLDLAIGAMRENELQTLLNAQLLWSKAMAYMELMDKRAELNSYNILIVKFKTSQNEEIQIYVANAIFNQGIAYGQQGQFDEVLNSYKILIEQFKESANEEIQECVAKAIFNQGVTYGQQGQFDEELNSYKILIEQFKASTNEAIQLQVASAMLNQGVTYNNQNKIDDELISYKILIGQFKASTNEATQEKVAKAMLNQGIAYGQQGQFDDELNSYKILIDQFKASTNEAIQFRVAQAMYSQGIAYRRKKDFTTALNIHSKLLAQFNNSDNAEIKTIVNDVRASMAEVALLFETPEQVLARIVEVENTSEDSQVLAVMMFIRFLLNDKTINDVLTAITAIPREMELTWQFDEIKEYLAANFTGEKQQQIQGVVAFFEQHKDIETLRNALGIQR